MQYLKREDLVRLIPFAIVLVITIVTWITILTTDYTAVLKHYVALGIIIINVLVNIVKIKWGIVLTGILLFLATFNLVSFFVVISSSKIGFNFGGQGIQLPPIQGYSLIIFILHFILNFNFLKRGSISPKENSNS